MAEPARASDCLDEDLVLAFAMGELSEGHRAGAEAHLDACEACRRVLSEAARGLARTLADGQLETDDVPWNTTFQPNAVVGGRYVIKRFIARGGMGEVYEAFDRELLQRVALKTVSSTVCDNLQAVRRLKAEVQLARRVSHPNVCRIYDLGRHGTDGGAPVHFLTMEFVEGETLGQRVRLAGALPVKEAQKVARELLLALRAAHESGVLHRDFKSDNVMLHADAEEQTSAVVLDFGLARAVDHDASRGASSRNLVGTFGYIAPEQLEGAPYTPVSDLYSFGVVWFEMLTGQLPFAAASSPTSSKKVLVGQVRAPSSVNPAVPVELDALVTRCLARRPEVRFQSAREVLEALDAMAGARRPVRARRARAVVSGLLATGLIVGLTAYWSFRRAAEPRPPSARPEAGPVVGGVPEPARMRETTPAVTNQPVPTPPRLATGASLPRSANRAVETTPVEAGSQGRASLPSNVRGAPIRDAVNPALPAPAPAPSVTPSPSVAPSRRRPDWENPFGATEPREVAVGNPRTPT